MLSISSIKQLADRHEFFVCPPPVRWPSERSVGLDLHLGSWFAFFRDSSLTHLSIKDGSNEDRIVREHYSAIGSKIILHPGQFVLGVTVEWITMPEGLCAHVIGKSSWGRRGLVIATATGVHPCFNGCLTLEIANLGRAPLEIQVGMPICQLFLDEVIELEMATATSESHGAHSGFRKPHVGSVRSDWLLDSLRG